MLKYVIYRILFTIPTIVLLLLIAFYLDHLAPGDQVTTRISLEGVVREVDQQEFDRVYRQEAKRLGKDLPLFYVQIKPNYFPSDLHRYQPKSDRNSLKSLLRQTGQWDIVKEYYEATNDALNQLEPLKTKYRDPYNFLRRLVPLTTVQSIKAEAVQLDEFVVSDDEVSTSLDRVKSAVDRLSAKSRFSYPVVVWNGSKNQFHFWLRRFFNPSQNVSLTDGKLVFPKIFLALKWTFSMALIALVLCCGIALLIAIGQVYYRNTWGERISSSILYGLYSVPLFWFASMMVIFFTTTEYGVWTNIFPSVGFKYWMVDEPFYRQWLANAQQLVLPIFCLVIHSLAYLVKQVKSSLLFQSSKQYVLAAHARGLSKKEVLMRHILPNGLLPFITIVSGSIPFLITGSVIIEVIFNIPGVGRLLLESVKSADWPISFSILVLVGIVTAVSYIIGDVVSVWMFPKVSKSLIDQ